MKSLVLVLTLLLAFFSHKSDAREYNRAMCILLKQQMAQFDHARQHPSYRNASREYNNNCLNLEQKTSQPSSATNTNTTKAAPPAPKTTVPVDSEPTAELEQTLDEQTPVSEPQLQATPEQKEEALATSTSTQQTQEKPTVKPKASTQFDRNGLVIPAYQPEDNPLIALIFPALVCLLVLAIGIALLLSVRSRQDEARVVKPKVAKQGKGSNKAVPTPPAQAEGLQKAFKKFSKKRPATLDPELYSKFNAVPVQIGKSAHNHTIEQLIVSQFGIFILCQPAISGDIYGSEKASEWTSKLEGDERKFANPIAQIHQQIEALSDKLQINAEEIIPIVAFENEAKFKSSLPHYVIRQDDFIDYVLHRNEHTYTQEQASEYIDKIRNLQSMGNNAALGRSSTKSLIAEAKEQATQHSNTAQTTERQIDSDDNASAQKPSNVQQTPAIPSAPDEGEQKADEPANIHSPDGSATTPHEPSTDQPLSNKPSPQLKTKARLTSVPKPTNVAKIKSLQQNKAEQEKPRAQIHQFVRKDASDNIAELPQSPKLATEDNTAVPSEPKSHAPASSTSTPKKPVKKHDWSSMSDDEFLAYLDQANNGSSASKSEPNQPKENAPSPEQKQSDMREERDDSPKAATDNSTVQAHTQERAPNEKLDDHLHDFDPSKPIVGDEHGIHSDDDLSADASDKPSAQSEATEKSTPSIPTPSSTSTQSKPHVKVPTETPSNPVNPEELLLDVDNDGEESLDDALAELESALAEQDKHKVSSDVDSNEPTDEQKKKDSSNPFANLSLDPNFKPKEEKIDIGAGPLDNEKPKP
ncbi:NERD domain-containing protein [Pseudoalteromonas sp. SSDWG2]|uniref:NERD domain-containing protein n=1 Tax=Pseudoalteromonas sp. SSDWG2 TaxID=3139391 RepID=UPI003BAC93D5